MKLHENKQEFYETILAVANKFNVSPAIVEKDYYVTLFLKTLVRKTPNILFKGGTSLSKCYKLINRFSEDIDLTLEPTKQTPANKRDLKLKIMEVCNDLGLDIMNISEIRSRRDYNKYIINYPVFFKGIGIKPHILVETVFMVDSFPSEVKLSSSMINDFLEITKDYSTIEEYEMEPFEISVQCLERTMIDKVFALCDYAVSNNLSGYSRHIYDLYKLIKVVKLDESLKLLVTETRNARKKHKRCYTANDKYNIPNILRQIIVDKVYYEDYINITEKVLFDNTPYDLAIEALNTIIESGIFE